MAHVKDLATRAPLSSLLRHVPIAPRNVIVIVIVTDIYGKDKIDPANAAVTRMPNACNDRELLLARLVHR
jgi:hypothetical protein